MLFRKATKKLTAISFDPQLIVAPVILALLVIALMTAGSKYTQQWDNARQKAVSLGPVIQVSTKQSDSQVLSVISTDTGSFTVLPEDAISQGTVVVLVTPETTLLRPARVSYICPEDEHVEDNCSKLQG